jgi:protein-S-isoprenylcysteine O-methyltransferase Ste14
MLDRNGIRGIAVQSIGTLVSFAILFAAAGRIDWVNAWAFFVFACLFQAVTWIVLAKVNPQVLNARGSIAKKGTKGFDRVWLALYPILSFLGLVVFGFDAVRFHWSSMPAWLSVFGLVAYIPVMVLGTWAMAVNKFFEWTVRIQDDRGQYVCTDGPYRFIRHPGYASLVVSVILGPLILGSWWGLIVSFVLAAAVVARTALEDRTLQKELPGYKEYAQKVKYKLVPFIW